jgi:hypothetical protein
MKKWAFILCMAMLTASCNSILSSRPSGTLSQEQMIDLLVDLHLNEATLRMANDSLSRIIDTTDLRIRFAQVFRKHDVKPDAFNASLIYYIEHIEELDQIYVGVIARLTEMEATLLPKVDKANNSKIKSRFGQPRYTINRWFPKVNKSEKVPAVQYFDSVKYPVPNEDIIYSPYRAN